MSSRLRTRVDALGDFDVLEGPIQSAVNIELGESGASFPSPRVTERRVLDSNLVSGAGANVGFLPMITLSLGVSLVAAQLSPAMAAYLQPAPSVTAFADLDHEAPLAYALAPGVVTEVSPGNGTVSVSHVYFVNHRRLRATLNYRQLSATSVGVGQVVGTGHPLGMWDSDILGQPLARRFDAVQQEGASGTKVDYGQFIRRRQPLLAPLEEPVLLLVHQADYLMAVVRRGKVERVVDIAFGQVAGAKAMRGDLRTPMGMYFVVQRHRGAFGGTYADYFGGHWLKINYPNHFDGQRGLKAGVVSRATAAQISSTWARRALTTQRTKLGSSIGFHGWIDDWRAAALSQPLAAAQCTAGADGSEPCAKAGQTPVNGRHLSFGCMVLDNAEIAEIYGTIPTGAMVVIF